MQGKPRKLNLYIFDMIQVFPEFFMIMYLISLMICFTMLAFLICINLYDEHLIQFNNSGDLLFVIMLYENIIYKPL